MTLFRRYLYDSMFKVIAYVVIAYDSKSLHLNNCIPHNIHMDCFIMSILK